MYTKGKMFCKIVSNIHCSHEHEPAFKVKLEWRALEGMAFPLETEKRNV